MGPTTSLHFGVVELVILIPLLLVIFGAQIATTIWAFMDAESRGKPGCLVALLVFFLCWPFSLLVWIIFRPDRDR